MVPLCSNKANVICLSEFCKQYCYMQLCAVSWPAMFPYNRNNTKRHSFFSWWLYWSLFAVYLEFKIHNYLCKFLTIIDRSDMRRLKIVTSFLCNQFTGCCIFSSFAILNKLNTKVLWSNILCVSSWKAALCSPQRSTVKTTMTHLVCRGSSWLDWWSRARSGTGTGTCSSRDGRGGLGRRFNFTARFLLLLLLLGLPTCPLLLGPLSVLLLLLLGDVLEAGLDASCAAASWRVKKLEDEKMMWRVHTLREVLAPAQLMLMNAYQLPQVWFSGKTGSASPLHQKSRHSVNQRDKDVRQSSPHII